MERRTTAAERGINARSEVVRVLHLQGFIFPVYLYDAEKIFILV